MSLLDKFLTMKIMATFFNGSLVSGGYLLLGVTGQRQYVYLN